MLETRVSTAGCLLCHWINVNLKRPHFTHNTRKTPSNLSISILTLATVLNRDVMKLCVFMKQDAFDSSRSSLAFFPRLTFQPPEEIFFSLLHFLYFSCKIIGGSDIRSAVKVWLWFYILSTSIICLTLPYKVFIPHHHPLTYHPPKRQKVETSASPPSLRLLCWKYCSHSTERFALSSFVNTHYHKEETLSLALECHVWIFTQ